MTVAKGNFNNGEHTLIPVKEKMIHSAVWECKRLVLKERLEYVEDEMLRAVLLE